MCVSYGAYGVGSRFNNADATIVFLFTARKRTKWLLDLFASISQLARVQVIKVYFFYHTRLSWRRTLFKEVYEEMFITRSSCREERSFVCMSVYEDSVVCTIPLSFIEVYFGFEIGFSFLLSHSALGLRLYLDYIL